MIPFTKELEAVYGLDAARRLAEHIDQAIHDARPRMPDPSLRPPLSQEDLVVIAYPDHLRQPEKPPLQTLADFCERRLRGWVPILHILPFFPSSSDDGFAVMDYERVEPGFGDWSDIDRLRGSFRLMFDAVLNHVSAQNEWFRAYLAGRPDRLEWFLSPAADADLTRVRRPRALPLVHEYPATDGPRRVWTTFSADQVDLNYGNPAVLERMLGILLAYAARGAEYLRLDAVAFLWKKPGTECIHLPQTHALVRLFRSVLEAAAPGTKLVSETNVPHTENVAYFGNGMDEAHLVYNFALPPLVLHTFLQGDARAISRWAEELAFPDGPATFLNFLASHDGIGLNPVRGLLSESEVQALIDASLARNGLASWKDDAGGGRSVYELNINYFDAITPPEAEGRMAEEAFLAAHRMLLSLRGVPAIYLHSLLGSRGWRDGPSRTGMARSVNREKLDQAALDAALDDPSHPRRRIFDRLREMIERRRASPAFHPLGGQRILTISRQIFGLVRTSPDGHEQVWYLQNVTGEKTALDTDLLPAFGEEISRTAVVDLASGLPFAPLRMQSLSFDPYQGYWLRRRQTDAGPKLEREADHA